MPSFPDAVLRAARLSRLPGVTIDAAAKRFRVTPAQVTRARREAKAETTLSVSDLLLSALTSEGRTTTGELGDLEALAGFLDYVNHDGSSASNVRKMLDALVEQGVLVLDGDRWKLRKRWP